MKSIRSISKDVVERRIQDQYVIIETVVREFKKH